MGTGWSNWGRKEWEVNEKDIMTEGAIVGLDSKGGMVKK